MTWANDLGSATKTYLIASGVRIDGRSTGTMGEGKALGPIDRGKEVPARTKFQQVLDRHIRTATLLLGAALVTTLAAIIGGMLLLWDMRADQALFKQGLYLLGPLLIVLFSFTLTVGTRVAALGMISGVLGELRPEDRPAFLRSIKWLNGEGSFRPLAEAFLRLAKPRAGD